MVEQLKNKWSQDSISPSQRTQTLGISEYQQLIQSHACWQVIPYNCYKSDHIKECMRILLPNQRRLDQKALHGVLVGLKLLAPTPPS